MYKWRLNDDNLFSMNDNDSFSVNDSDFFLINNSDFFSINDNNLLSTNNNNFLHYLLILSSQSSLMWSAWFKLSQCCRIVWQLVFMWCLEEIVCCIYRWRLNDDDFFSVNNDDLLSVNNDNSFSMNNEDFFSINNSDLFSINDDDSLSINDDNFFSINNNNSFSVNDSDSFSVNDDNFFSVNNNNFLSINNNSLHYHLNSFFIVKHRVKIIVNVDIIVCLSSYNIFTLKNNIYNSFNIMILFLMNISNAHVTHLWLTIIYLVQTYACLLRFTKNSVSW